MSLSQLSWETPYKIRRTWKVPPFRTKSLLESNPLKSKLLIGGLGILLKIRWQILLAVASGRFSSVNLPEALSPSFGALTSLKHARGVPRGSHSGSTGTFCMYVCNYVCMYLCMHTYILEPYMLLGTFWKFPGTRICWHHTSENGKKQTHT